HSQSTIPKTGYFSPRRRVIPSFPSPQETSAVSSTSSFSGRRFSGIRINQHRVGSPAKTRRIADSEHVPLADYSGFAPGGLVTAHQGAEANHRPRRRLHHSALR